MLVQNPHTFSDDIARGNLPPTATDPHPDAQPTEPDTEEHALGYATEQSAQENAAYPWGRKARRARGEEKPDGTSPNAPVYPNPAHPMGTPEDLLYNETGLIVTTVSNVDGVSMVEIDPEATEIEAPVAGDAAPQTPPPDDKATVDDELARRGRGSTRRRSSRSRATTTRPSTPSPRSTTTSPSIPRKPTRSTPPRNRARAAPESLAEA